MTCNKDRNAEIAESCVSRGTGGRKVKFKRNDGDDFSLSTFWPAH